MPTKPTANAGESPTPPPLLSAPPPRSASAEAQVDLGALSHPGKVRSKNEDCYLVARVDRALNILLTNLPEGSLAARFDEVGYGMLVADGMGGYAGGEVASRLAITSLVRILVHTSDWIMRTEGEDAERLLERIAERYRQVNAALKQEAQADPQLTEMGTTMTLAYSLGSDLFLGHVGDSRVYFRRGKNLYQLTRDHTYAQALADLGVIQPQEVVKHRFRHVLTKALGGTADKVEADVQRARLCDGDQILLCTDGLTEMVSDAAISATLGEAQTAGEACQMLIDLALRNGGKDNVTAVVGRYRFPPR
jgi:protein phosphatase